MPGRPTDRFPSILTPAANDDPGGPGDVTVSFHVVAQVFVPSAAAVPTSWRQVEQGGTIELDRGDGPEEFTVYDVEEIDGGRWIRGIASDE